MTPQDLIDIVRRRFWLLVIPIVLITSSATVIALILPATYRSSATILIEDQEIPPEFVMATVTTYAEKRIESIRQRIMSTTRLLEIINHFDLYKKEREQRSTEEVAASMRHNIKLTPISANVKDPRGFGKSGSTTIAFKLSFQGRNPYTVQRVATKLTSLFLEENLKVRERQTMETTKFLEDEMNKVGEYLFSIEKEIATFKQQHINELPELYQTNLQMLSSLEREVGRLVEQRNGLKDREAYLQSQLATLPPHLEKEKQTERLDLLKEKLVSLEARFTRQHPDVVKTRAEIATLEKDLKTTTANGQHRIDTPDNPAYIAIQAQLESLKLEYGSLDRQIEDLRQQKDEYQQRIETTPKIEQRYNTLLIERKNTQLKYNDLMRKVMEARVAHGLEKEQKGERFTLIDPARLPEKPFKPNRVAIILMGIVLGVGTGVGLAALLEYTDQSVRKVEALTMAFKLPVLAGIPLIITDRDKRIRRNLRIACVFGTVFVAVAGIIVFHYTIMDLDILWAKINRFVDRKLMF